MTCGSEMHSINSKLLKEGMITIAPSQKTSTLNKKKDSTIPGIARSNLQKEDVF